MINNRLVFNHFELLKMSKPSTEKTDLLDSKTKASEVDKTLTVKAKDSKQVADKDTKNELTKEE